MEKKTNDKTSSRSIDEAIVTKCMESARLIISIDTIKNFVIALDHFYPRRRTIFEGSWF